MSGQQAVEKAEFTYYVLIPLLVPRTMDRVISVLVKRGYTVGPLSQTGSAYTSRDDNAVTILALNIKKKFPINSVDVKKDVFDDIKDVLKVTDTYYYMLWVGEPSECMWALGNIVNRKEDNVETNSAGGKGLN